MTPAWLTNSQVRAYMENPFQTMAQEKEGGKLHAPAGLVLLCHPQPDASAAIPVLCGPAEAVTLRIRLGEGKGEQCVGRGSQGSSMNSFSGKHGVQTGGLLLSCFSSVKASISSTLIIKSEQ